MNQNIITYLNENKEKYSKDALIAELKKAGYAEGDITEGIAQVFNTPAPAKTSFWNFKNKKVYTKASEKWADFLFGVFVSVPFFYIVSAIFESMPRIPFIGLVPVTLYTVVVVYLFKHRRFMFYGMMPLVAFLALFVAGVFFVGVISAII